MNVLIVDDEQANRLILQAMLKKSNHVVIEACDGQEAVELFEEHQPDLVLMDVMMPVMDGYEATSIIKQKSGSRFTPVIFLTAITDEDALVKCIEHGGDDFLTKPYNRTILQAKISAMERIRQLNSTISAQNKELEDYHKYLQHEQEVAEKIFSKLMQQGENDLPMINAFREPAATFNGDIFLVSRQPSGVVYLLVGDFTGHGLAAALGALPATQIFYAMCNKGFAIEEIIIEINQRLKALLPTGMFLAASLLKLDPSTSTASIWHGGLPDIILVNGQDNSISKLTSQHLPLGVVGKNSLNYGAEHLHLNINDRIIIYSDGLIETFNKDGEIFGMERLDNLILSIPANIKNYVEKIIANLDEFRGDEVSHDDVTVVEFVCDDEFYNSRSEVVDESAIHNPRDWELSFTFKHELLGRVDPLPILMNVLRDIQGLHKYKEDLFLILSELYMNALDYGVLHMDSSIKGDAGGFEKYYAERELRLKNLKNGWVKIVLADKKNGRNGYLTIIVEDSGKGFKPNECAEKGLGLESKHGRGVALIKLLATSLIYNEEGNRAEVLYEWQ